MYEESVLKGVADEGSRMSKGTYRTAQCEKPSVTGEAGDEEIRLKIRSLESTH